MDNEPLISIVVPQNLPDEARVMGVPLREIAFTLMGPIGVATLMRFFNLDFTIPFPVLFREIMFSSFLIWICGPVLFLALRAWKKRHPDVDLVDAVRGFFGRRSWTAGARDLELASYLADATAPADFTDYEPLGWAERSHDDVRAVRA